jgi:hypothetical protein
MDQEHAQAAEPTAATNVSQYPALSISKPPPKRERVMTYTLSTLFGGALLLALAGVVAHWLHLP